MRLLVLAAALMALAAPPAWAQPLTDRGRENLTAFARLYGYVRWFHPTPAGVDWDALALSGIERSESAQSSEELAEALQDHFSSFAPELRVVTGHIAPDPAPLVPGPTMRWRHVGVGSGAARFYSSTLEPATETETLRGALPGGVSFGMAVTAPMPPWSGGPVADPGEHLAGNDRTSRLAATIIAWNVLQHFFPYHDVTGADWPAELSPALSAAAVATDRRAFADTLRHLLIPLEDGHGGINYEAMQARAPIQWDWIDDRLVITSAGSETWLSTGDIVISINGAPAEEALAASLSLITGSPQWRMHRALEALRAGNPGESLALEVQGADAVVREVQVAFSERRRGDTIREPRPNIIAELRPSVWYVDLSRITADQLEAAWEDLATARAVVFDMRGYPDGLSPTILGHLTDTPIRTAPFNVLTTRLPDRDPRGITANEVGWPVAPVAPRVTGQVVFLTDGRAISYAETLMGMAEAYNLGERVGGPTAGANGNVANIDLPGGWVVRWTGMQVTRHDGAILHGEGIPPTVPVSRTIEGVRAGRDEVLDAALDLIGDD